MSLFNLPQSVSQLPDINEGVMDAKYEQIAPSRDSTGSNFANGAQHYRWEVAGNRWWCPSKSYMRIRVNYTYGDAAAEPVIPAGTQLPADSTAVPAPFMVSNLFQSAEIRIGDRTVGRIGQYLAQVDALKNRMTRSKPWLDSIGENTNLASADVATRRNEVCTTSGENPATNGGRRANQIELYWKPCLNLFDHQGCLPAGKYELILNPENQSQYQTNAYVTTADNAYNLQFTVDDIYLYAHTISGPNVSNMTYALDLQNVHCQIDKVQNASLTQRFFDVSPSTVALAVAFQDARLTNRAMTASNFTVSSADLENYGEGKNQNSLSRFFVSYANMQKPQPDANPEYDLATANQKKNRFTHRYAETMLENGLIHNDAGCETYDEWQKRGCYFLQNFPKSGEDSSTRVQVNQEFNGLGAADIENMRVLLFSISRTSAQITVNNGQVSDVILKER